MISFTTPRAAVTMCVAAACAASGVTRGLEEEHGLASMPSSPGPHMLTSEADLFRDPDDEHE